MNSRRDFIQMLSAPIVALPFISSMKPAEIPYDGPVLRIAIMGLGGYATRVAEAMLACKKAKLVGLISGTPSKIKAWSEKYSIEAKNCYDYTNFDAIKNNPGCLLYTSPSPRD